jgi:hypothetical protein
MGAQLKSKEFVGQDDCSVDKDTIGLHRGRVSGTIQDACLDI